MLENLAPGIYKNHMVHGYRQGVPTSTLMTQAYELLQSNHNETPSTILSTVSKCPINPTMLNLLQFLNQHSQVQCGIISDANSLYIEKILERYGIDIERCFGAGVFTNMAKMVEGKIWVEPCLKGGHFCKRKCPKNICKESLTRGMVVQLSFLLFRSSGLVQCEYSLRLEPKKQRNLLLFLEILREFEDNS